MPDAMIIAMLVEVGTVTLVGYPYIAEYPNVELSTLTPTMTDIASKANIDNVHKIPLPGVPPLSGRSDLATWKSFKT